MIERSWQPYPLGLLFGLGFNTATEVGVFGISAAQPRTAVDLVDPGVSSAVYGGHVANGYDEQP